MGDIEGGVAVVSRMLASPPGGGAGGGGVGINILRKGGGVVGGDEEVTAEGFARGVQDSWRVGKRGCDNGFVLVASREDRSFATSVGKGLERYLPPRDRNAALNAMKPLLREGDWDGAVLLALEEIHGRLLGNLAKAAGGGGGGDGDAGALSSLGWGWEDLKRWASDGRGGSGGSSGSGDGGGGGGGFRGFHLGGFGNFFGESWNVDVPPGSVLLALSLLWGGATARASLQRRRYDRFEAKLAGIETQRAMLPLSAGGGGWSVEQDALASRGVCPICLDAFSEAVDGSGADTKGLVGADGMPAATLPDCGHTFCQRRVARPLMMEDPCLSRWNGDGSGSSSGNPQACPCPICDAPTPAVGDPRLGRTSRRRRAPRPGPLRRRRRRPRRGEEDVGFFGFRWPGSSSSWGGGRSRDGRGGVNLRFSPSPRSSGWTSDKPRGLLPSPIATPPPPPPPPPPPSTPPPPPPPPPPIRPPGASGNPGVSRTGRLGQTGGEQARERARREAAFQLASLGSQYPKFLDDRTVNRWLSKDYSSSWSRDPMLALNRPPDTGSDNSRVGGGGARKGSGWVTNGSRGLGGGDRRSYGGGSSSSATGGGW
ncbi:unnamed protein product [Ectocarpus sp. 8 AP-2014]